MREDRSLLATIEDAITSGKVALPARHQTARQLQGVLAQQNHDIREILEIIEADQALTAEVLRVANSPFYGGLAEITTVRNAVVRIGGAEVVRLAIAVVEREAYQVRDAALSSLMTPLWDHALAAALASRWLAHRLGYRDLENEAFIAGLLHDVGKLLIVRIVDDLKTAGELDPDTPAGVVHEAMRSAHGRHGATLLAHWRLPEAYLAVVRGHHDAVADPRDPLLLLVRLANQACRNLGIGLHHDPSLVLAATEEAHALDVREIMLAELAIMLEDRFALVG